MDGAEVQNLIERLRFYADQQDRVIHIQGPLQARLRDAADALEGFRRAIVAHHDIATLSQQVLAKWRAQEGSGCPICREATEMRLQGVDYSRKDPP